jgi:hypothetical protein
MKTTGLDYLQAGHDMQDIAGWEEKSIFLFVH